MMSVGFFFCLQNWYENRTSVVLTNGIICAILQALKQRDYERTKTMTMYRVRNERHETIFETSDKIACLIVRDKELAKGHDVYAQEQIKFGPYEWDYGWVEIF
jgi:hypothetical protein